MLLIFSGLLEKSTQFVNEQRRIDPIIQIRVFWICAGYMHTTVGFRSIDTPEMFVAILQEEATSADTKFPP